MFQAVIHFSLDISEKRSHLSAHRIGELEVPLALAFRPLEAIRRAGRVFLRIRTRAQYGCARLAQRNRLRCSRLEQHTRAVNRLHAGFGLRARAELGNDARALRQRRFGGFRSLRAGLADLSSECCHADGYEGGILCEHLERLSRVHRLHIGIALRQNQFAVKPRGEKPFPFRRNRAAV